MAELAFECLDVHPLRYGVAPALVFRLHIAEVNAAELHAIALRVQIRIEPQLRQYAEHEAELLTYLFGERARWGETLKPMQFTSASVMVPSFTGSAEVDLEVPCTYDMEVAAGKYFHALDDGVVPMVLLFSGTVFAKGEKGFWVHPIPWRQQATYRMPMSVWRDMMDSYFPHEAWIRLDRDTVDAVLRYKSANAIPTWDDAIRSLLKETGS
jgi:hypothetical protein